MKHFLYVVILLTLSATVHAQDTLLLMNGQELLCKIKSDSGTVILMELTKKNGKVKSREIHKSEIFSVIKKDSAEVVLYTQNEMFGDVFTPEEMRFYMAGERDARNNFKANHIFIIGLVACGSIAYYGGDGYLTAFAPPITFTLAQLLGKVKIKEKTMSDVRYKYNVMSLLLDQESSFALPKADFLVRHLVFRFGIFSEKNKHAAFHLFFE
jgi:hypothetical protein